MVKYRRDMPRSRFHLDLKFTKIRFQNSKGGFGKKVENDKKYLGQKCRVPSKLRENHMGLFLS